MGGPSIRRRSSKVTVADGEPEFVLGTAQLGSNYGIGGRRSDAPHAEAPSVFLAGAHDLGVEVLDTAPAYGRAETLIGEAHWSGRVHTKVSPGSDPRSSTERSLELLRREQVDLLYLHESAVVLDPTAPVLAAAHKLVGSRVLKLGASIYDEAEFDAVLRDDRIEAVQVPCNVLDRRFSGVRLAAAVSSGMDVYVRSALLQGALAMPTSELPEHLRSLRPYIDAFHLLAAEMRRTPLEVALAWARSLPGVRGVIVGTSSVAELIELLAAFRVAPLTPVELDRLNELPTPQPQLTDPRTWKVTP